MNLHFFGGANEVGASCTLIKIDGYRILVDAGIRMGPGQNSPLPDFLDFDKADMPDAVLLTHAHTDHIGALPVLRDLWIAGVKVYYTPATKAITRVLLKDSAERMQREEQEEGKPPPYTPDDVDVALHCMEKEVPWLEPVPICGDVTATWIPAGHILGAAMIYIKGKHESILMTGDVSVTKQLTIPGLVVPPWCKRPDVMVMESTYGNCQHKVNRREEEKKLAADVANTVIKEGGTVLIPVFAIGRAQEVILILKQAMERKEIREFPVYVDGMVRDVNSIYSQFPDELQRRLRRTAKQRESLFDSNVIKEVPRNHKPEDVLAGEPCCIVASSGMLIGGRSVQYAEHLVRDSKNLIAITGYQAEGTPGCALWNWVEVGRPPDQMWELKDQEPVRVECQVKKYSLSAHADSKELLALVEKVQPRKLFLVHGDTEARGELFKSVGKACSAVDAKLPENGQTYLVKKRVGISRGRQLSNDRILSEVAAFVRKMRAERPFRVRELAEIWFGTEGLTPVAVKFFEWCVSLNGRFFERRTDDLFYPRHV